MQRYTYDDAERDAKRITEYIGGSDTEFTEAIRRAFRDSYERAYYAGYYRGLDDTSRHSNERR